MRNGFIRKSYLILSENDIFGREYKRKTRFKKQNSKALQSFIDLKEGDYVVHIHPVGGTALVVKKFLKLEYSG
ncbi:hypothetical protein LEP1GSC085_2367 [Leptospira interrogans str. L0996]|nr:hypothetical protein LEP1GSC085_2367 [Leptospira interrogans str. L0996]